MPLDQRTKEYYADLTGMPLEDLDDMDEEDVALALDEDGARKNVLRECLLSPSAQQLTHYQLSHGKAFIKVVDQSCLSTFLCKAPRVAGVFSSSRYILDVRPEDDVMMYCRQQRTGVWVNDFPVLTIYDWGMRRLVDETDSVLEQIAQHYIFGEDIESDAIAVLRPRLERTLLREAASTRKKYSRILKEKVLPRAEELKELGLYF